MYSNAWDCNDGGTTSLSYSFSCFSVYFDFCCQIIEYVFRATVVGLTGVGKLGACSVFMQNDAAVRWDTDCLGY